MRPLHLLVVLLSIVAVASIGVNAVLLLRVASDYAATSRLRLDPVGASRFAAANATLQGRNDDRPRVVFFGDSRIAQWADLPALANAERINRGIGSETTAQVLLRLERDVLALQPDLVVVQVGVNDLKCIGVLPERADSIRRDCEAHLRQLATHLTAAGIDVALLTVFPCGPLDWGRRLVWSPEIEAAVAEVNDKLRDWGLPRVTVLDCDPVLAPSGTLESGYARDTLHLTAAGYSALNAAFAGPLTRLLHEKE